MSYMTTQTCSEHTESSQHKTTNNDMLNKDEADLGNTNLNTWVMIPPDGC